MNELLETALKYHELGLSVIPVKRNKKPFVKWERYQTEKADAGQIKQWWKRYPSANVAIVTGKISGVSVIDVDSEDGYRALEEKLPETMLTPIARTQSGGRHYYFRCRDGLSNTVKFLDGCDFRGEGGYVVAPPSFGINGNPYRWLPELVLGDVEPAPLPDALYNVLIYNSMGGEREEGTPSPLQTVTGVTKRDIVSFNEGHRDETLFCLANHLVKGGMPVVSIQKYITFFAQHCSPPFPKEEIPLKIQSALKRSKNRERSLSQEILDWVSVTKGDFSVTECDKELEIVTKEEKTNRRQVFCRLVKDGMLERNSRKNGVFRLVNKECEAIDFLNADIKTVNIRLPFAIEDMVEIMPGNIILLAGEPNTGKTAFLLNAIKMNMDRFKVHYFNSEMGASELRKRLLNYPDPRVEVSTVLNSPPRSPSLINNRGGRSHHPFSLLLRQEKGPGMSSGVDEWSIPLPRLKRRGIILIKVR